MQALVVASTARTRIYCHMETTLSLQEVASYVLRKDISNLLDFIERLKNEEDQIALHMDQIEKLKLKLTIMSTFLQLSYFSLDGFNDRMSSKALQVDDLVESLFHQSRDDMLVKLKDHIVPRLLETIKSYINSQHHYSKSTDTMTEDQLVEILDELLVSLHDLPKCCAELIFPLMTQYKVIQNVCVNIRDFHGLKVNGCVKHEIVEYVLPQFQRMAERVGHFCFVLFSYHLDVPQVNFKLAHLLMKIIPVELEVMHICSTNLEASKSAEVGRFIKQLQESSPAILREYLIHLQVHMVTVLNASTSARSIHVIIEFLLIILTDMPKDFIYHDKLFDLLARVGALTREVSILVCNLEENSRNEENMNETNCGSLDLLESIELLKEDLKHVFLKAPKDSSQLCFPKSDGPIFMTLLLRNLNDLLKSDAYSAALIKEEVQMVKEDLEFIRSFFGKVEQKLNRDLWNCVLDAAYEAEHSINSILVRDHGLLQLIFLLPRIIEKIKLIKEEVQQKIPKNRGLVVVNSPKKPIEISKSSATSQIIVGFEKETKEIISKLTKGPTEIDVISIVGMPGLGKTTLAYKVYNEKFVVDHFDVRAWCTVDQERNEKKLLQKIYNQVIGLKERFNEDGIDDDVADKLRKQLCGKRYLVVLDDLWDIATWDELTRPFPEFQKGSRIILTSRIQEIAVKDKRHSDPLYLRFLTQGESWELLERKVFGEKSCPKELLGVGEEIAQKCEGLPLVLDLIGGVIARKEKIKAFWLEVLNNLKSIKNEVKKVIQLSYDHLSDHLKPCLLYLASCPKDESIEISQLKDLWSAEGLVEQTEMKSVEEVMEIYVDELISSSLVIVFNERGRASSCRIHDLVHDFCLEKARKEKLFDFISSSAPSNSSSDLMPRGMTIRYDRYLLPWNENLVLFNPEKKNPYVKHLLSLKVSDGKLNHLSYNCHLRHLRLLKRLELHKIRLTYSLLNDICMLVHLRCLKIQMKAKALPPSFSNLLNLETLVVDNQGTNMVLSPSIWSLAKLRHMSIDNCSLFDSDIDEPTVLKEHSKLENLRILYGLKLSSSGNTEDIFKRFPNLRSLMFTIDEPWPCSAEQISLPRLDILKELEEVWAYFDCASFRQNQWDFHFPSSLKELVLTRFNLTSDLLSRIGRLSNLQKLTLEEAIIQGKEWNMEKEDTFENLKLLILDWVSFSEWKVGEESFPVLEELHIKRCDELMEIPDSFADIASLKSISLWGNPQLVESAHEIKECVAETMGEDKLEVTCFD
ncbi:putative late blight resistance protein homolog R1A-3 isoform X1 [Nicotiana tomentosiformis]|uniref:putative late blight resistance protein homolog R1A-3 isoform X1 n=1 Tax=Nicotiana tomentosiformis TaxID=4098 RepID=UPI00051C4CF7|nr:putative late blight resistance protein homolog R1A-3 isoform X1 [Nicotiana tomentosiformis]